MSGRGARLARLGALAAVGLAAVPAVAAAATLTVEVTGVASGHGAVRVALCPPEAFLKPGCPLAASAAAKAGSTTVEIEAPPGVYGVQAFHDANGNHGIDRNFLGLPEEGIGFGNDAPMRFGPPAFADAAVEVGPGPGRTTLHLRYLAGR